MEQMPERFNVQPVQAEQLQAAMKRFHEEPLWRTLGDIQNTLSGLERALNNRRIDPEALAFLKDRHGTWTFALPAYAAGNRLQLDIGIPGDGTLNMTLKYPSGVVFWETSLNANPVEGT